MAQNFKRVKIYSAYCELSHTSNPQTHKSKYELLYGILYHGLEKVFVQILEDSFRNWIDNQNGFFFTI